MNRVLFSIFRKEVIHIFRDPQSLFMVLTMPLLMLFLYGYAINLEMKSIDTAIIDLSRTPESRALIDRVDSTDFFRVTRRDVAEADIETLFMGRSVRCALVIPMDFAAPGPAARARDVQLIVDASDPNAANYINNYLGQIVREVNAASGEAGRTLFSVNPRIFYNPDLKSAYFIIPGLIALILILISALLTSIAISREKETGTMEQVLVSPVKPSDVILGKVLPYTIVGFLDGAMILAVGSLWFQVPIHGSILLILAMMVIYIVTGISLGILISTLAQTQAIAMLITVIITILPTVTMSGFIFPISSMPRPLQYVAAIVPATYFLQIIRGIVLKGNTIADLYVQAGILLAMDAILITLSVRLFRAKLE